MEVGVQWMDTQDSCEACLVKRELGGKQSKVGHQEWIGAPQGSPGCVLMEVGEPDPTRTVLSKDDAVAGEQNGWMQGSGGLGCGGLAVVWLS